jgi:heme-degrading monooxygenase HmoA
MITRTNMSNQRNLEARAEEEYAMQKVLIDTFIVPDESKSAFLERTRKVQSFLKTLPGFVEGFIYEKTDGESHFNFITTAVWENGKAFENAKKAMAAEYQKLGFNPKDTITKLKIESKRAVYQRSPY